MKYISLITKFWEFNVGTSLGVSAIAVYFYIIKKWFDNQSEDFNLSDIDISKNLLLSRKTVKVAKDKLQMLGLIQFETKKGFPSYYKVCADYFSEKPIIDIISDNRIVSPLTNKKKPAIQKPNQSVEIVKVIPSKSVPTLDEFMKFVNTLSNYNIDLESVVQSKYRNWVANNWKNNYDKEITNWKAAIKNSLPYMKINLTTGQPITLPKIIRPK